MGAPYLRTSAVATETTVEAAMARMVVDFIFVDRVGGCGVVVVVVVGRG